tara:strand:- start:307 stop:600 length:294 start_codon:yes stop_codon:yes gene_type:complete
MNSQQPIGEEDINEAIKAYGDNPNFLKKILEGSKTRKKVENFLGGQQMVMHDYEKDPELIKNLYEIINTPGYDPDSVREAQRQILRIRQGLPRFPTA